jgi:hypothetical protein
MTPTDQIRSGIRVYFPGINYFKKTLKYIWNCQRYYIIFDPLLNLKTKK